MGRGSAFPESRAPAAPAHMRPDGFPIGLPAAAPPCLTPSSGQETAVASPGGSPVEEPLKGGGGSEHNGETGSPAERVGSGSVRGDGPRSERLSSPTPKKPIIGKEAAGAGAGAGEPGARPGRFQLLRQGRCIRSWKR